MQRTNWRLGNVVFIFILAAFCLEEFSLYPQSETYREYVAILSSLQWVLSACLLIWFGAFLFLMFSWHDWLLIGFTLLVIILHFIGYTTRPVTDALVFFGGATLGKGVCFGLRAKEKWRHNKITRQEIINQRPQIKILLICLIGLFEFSAWWHLDASNNPYRGPRWMGLWDNPNTYGVLMGAGVLLAIGLLAANAKLKIKNSKTNWFLGIALFMLAVGLMMSYSRGAWLATGVALLYLAWCYGKLKWQHIAIGFGVLVLASGLVWGRTHDSAPWYVKRADLSRPSAQNRATAWRAGLEIMRDHPLGVGWNKAVSLYGEKYHPPEGGPGALTTNDYLMIGTELGIPALVCFVAYVGLCFRRSPRLGQCKIQNEKFKMETCIAPSSQPSPPVGEKESEALRAACLAGALVFVVAFWFDGGLFKLPTAAMFWVLLELGAYRGNEEGRMLNQEVGARA